MGSGWNAGVKTLRIGTLSLFYLTAEYCALVWCRSAHTRLIDNVLKDALSIVTGYLHLTPTDHLPILSCIQPTELRQMGATLSLAHRGSLDPDHILHGLLGGSSDTRQVRLRSRRPFVPATRSLLDNLARLGIRASEWTNHKWKTKYCEGASRFRAFVPRTGARPVGMGLPQAALVKLNRLRTSVGRFHSSMHKWGLVPSPNCECGASEQTADHVLTACPIHRAPHGARGLKVLDRLRRRLKSIHSRSDTNRTGAEGLSFYYPRLLHCLDQTLAVMSLSQHRVSSSKTVRPRAPCGARCIGHAVSTWSAVCSEAPHSQFGEGARPHLCINE